MKLRFVLTSALALAAFSANAADLGGYKDGSADVGVNWSGLYVGINGGYGWSAGGSTVQAYADYSGYTATSGITTYDKTGGFGGGQIGYSFQQGRFVYGLETDIEAGSVGGKGSAFVNDYEPIVFPSPGQFNVLDAATQRQSTLDWFGTFRARLGYATGSWLFYLTGGLAYGETQGSASVTVYENIFNVAKPYSATTSAFHVGAAVGGGIEYAVTPAWSIKGEYQLIDFGKGSGYIYYQDNNGGYNLGRGNFTIDQNFNTVRFGLNYHISSGNDPLK